jgi:hypothetical protein
MPKSERLYSAEEAAYMTRLALASFRTKVSRLGIKGKKDGRNVFYTLEEIAKVNKRSTAIRKSTPTRTNG